MANHFCIWKKQHTVCAHFHSPHSCLRLAAEWITTEICAVKSYMMIFIILDSSKNFWNKNWLHKKRKEKIRVLVQWFCGQKKTEQTKKSVKYTVGGLDCFCRAANAIHVTFNIDVHWFHNIKNRGWSVIGLPVCYVRTHARRWENVCSFAECVIEGMPRLSSACVGFPGCPCDV